MSEFYFPENLICIDNSYKPKNLHQWGPGIRDLFALHYVISGSGTIETGGVRHPVRSGESFIVFPRTEVFYYPDHRDPWEYIWVDFRGEEAIKLLNMTRFTSATPVAPPSPVSLEPLFHIMDHRDMKPFERERSNAKLRLLLSYYMEFHPKEHHSSKTDYADLAKNYIENHYWRSTLSVTEIVEFVNVERTYLFRLFKEAYGMSLLHYLTVFRIRAACDILKDSSLPVKSIAYSVGFPDQMYFAKVFKKVMGTTPTEYAKLHTMEKLCAT